LQESNADKFKREVLLFDKLFSGDGDIAAGGSPDALSRQISFNLEGHAIEMPSPSNVLVQMLDHSPSISPVDSMYLVLELGQFSLHDWVQHGHDTLRAGKACPMDERELLRVMLHVALGLLFLHSQNFVHGDLKPANIMWFGNAGRPAWKLIDLDGLLKVDEKIDMRSASFYTMTYAPPELARAFSTKSHLRVSRHMDVWSLGAVLLGMELLATPLFETHEAYCRDGAGGEDAFLQWLGSEPRPLVVPEQPRFLPSDLEAVLRDKVLLPDPDQRLAIPALLQLPVAQRARAIQDGAPPSLSTPEPAEAAAPAPKPPTAWQLFQDKHAPALREQGLKGGPLTRELHKRWKLLQAEGGEELDALRRQEAELREGGAALSPPMPNVIPV
jgi:serine/threonine protein kinase